MALGIQNLPMRQRILLALLLTAAIALFAVGGIGYFYGRDALEEAAYNQLISIRENKKREIEGYFADLQRQLGVLSHDYTTIETMRGFSLALEQLKFEAPAVAEAAAMQRYYEQEMLPRLNANCIQPQQVNRFVPRQPLVQRMQHDYIAANPNPTGEKHLLNRAPNRSRPYDQLHERFHPHFRRILNEFDYYDIFLVEPETGHIIYSVFKEVDYFTSLIDGPYAHTNFGRAFRAAAASNDPSKTFFVDFEGYAPSYNAPACFISAPVFDGGTKIGVLIVQVSINAIDRIMTGNRSWRQSGLGESGETYLVGPDFRMRNNSRFLFEDRANFLKQLAVYNVPDTTRKLVERLNTTILQLAVRSPAAQQAVGGVAGLQVVPDYRKQGYSVAKGEVPPMDGMDISIVSIDLQTYHVQFAGAGRPMYYYHKGQLETLKGDKMSIGGTALMAENAIYTKQEVRLEAGDLIYLFSDGITDQFNADDSKKVGAKRLREWIELVHHEPLARQQALLNQLMNDWMGNTPQTDDMILMGLKLGKG